MRGCQKRVIYVKNTGNRNFEEAYFVVSGGLDGRKTTEAELVFEANKIIEENFGKRRGKAARLGRWHILAFFLGFAISLLLSYFLKIIF
jgi:hypothetical protein